MTRNLPPVADRTCPQCRAEGARLASEDGVVLTFCCEVCGCRWTEPERRTRPRQDPKTRSKPA